ncbi:low temperature requirement protein A [Actinomadura violacea]|uniref:Low temperature requirement protein A n=1 Tax=Actinomadura violacea TaxID=2819934 RepID=A0ABS3SB07_9ACTN|nr:low temperature requirement protein A [Actinomadura violacea]MBO2465369.1 low temperature requirement protein A [Actinomadura violacea]
MSKPEPLGFRREVSPLELFFDLVFVFAVSQLSHHLLEHLSWRGAAQAAVLLVAVFGAWAYTSFEATLLDIDRRATRWMIVIAMGLGLFMNAAISHAFTDRAWAFVAPLLLILFFGAGVTAVTVPAADLRGHYRRLLVWTTASAPLWIAGALVDPGPRLWWWTAAALIDLTGTWLAHPLPGHVFSSRNLDFDADHMLERLRLFFIIVLGETVLTVGTAIADAPIGVATVLASAGVFTALVCLWAVYFGGGENLVTAFTATTSDPMRSVRLAMNTAYIVQAALIALAVAGELVVAHPEGHGSPTLALLLFGGPALYLAAQAWYYRATTNSAWPQRLLAGAALAAAGITAVWLPPLASLALLDAILIGATALLTRTHRHLTDTPPDGS